MPLAILHQWQTAPAPVVRLDFLDYDERRVQWFTENFQKKLADAGNQRRLFLSRHGVSAGAGALLSYLDGDYRHEIPSFAAAS